MSARCRRLWEVEAARDGRLVGHALRSFGLHAETCRDCREERRAFGRLGRALTTASPADDEVALRRGRDRLLSSVDAQHHRRAATPKLRQLAIAAVAVVLIGGGAAARAARRSTLAVHVASITASAGARWEQHLRGNAEEVTLSDGTLSIVVHRSPADPRVTVRVPDGEIEDIGTAFRVTVQQDETREIAVDDGAIIFHRNGQQPTFVGSGSVWKASPPPGLAAATVANAPATAIRDGIPVVRHPKHAVQRTQAAVVAAATSDAPLAAPDPGAEDAAYLRIIALRRQGRIDAARAAAATYLTEFPSGFRRADVLRFALTSH